MVCSYVLMYLCTYVCSYVDRYIGSIFMALKKKDKLREIVCTDMMSHFASVPVMGDFSGSPVNSGLHTLYVNNFKKKIM